MIRINLLPVRVSRRQEQARRDLLIGALVLLVVVVVCAVLFVVQQARLSDLRATNAALKTDIENLKRIVAQVDETDKLNQELQRKLDVIRRLKASKTGPVRMLDELSSATPERLHLTSLEEKNGQVTLEGAAVSNEVISQFLSNLEQSEWFDDVFLIEIDQEEVQGYKLKTFSVTARLVVPGAKADETEPS